MPWATRHFQKTLCTLKPDAIWVIPYGCAIAPLAEVLPRANIGFHVSMEDYPDVRGMVAIFGVEYTRNRAVMTDRLYGAATTRDATSHPMITDLLQRTGSEAAQMLHAGLDREDFDWLSVKSEPHSDAIRIGYAGTILVEKEFAMFARALARIRQQLPQPIWLDFYGAQSYRSRKWFDAAWMKEHGSLPAQRLSEELRRCTWGFAPMGLTDDDPRYNRFSFPTKFISYLAAGLPVITLGHPESSVVKMASSHKVGLCMTTGNEESLSTELLAALSDPNPWLTYRTGIQRCAETEFNARRMRAVLYESFQKCASHSRSAKFSTPDSGMSRSKTV